MENVTCNVTCKFPVNDFRWVEYVSEFNRDFTKILDDDSDEGYFLEVDAQYSEIVHKFHNGFPFFTRTNEY